MFGKSTISGHLMAAVCITGILTYVQTPAVAAEKTNNECDSKYITLYSNDALNMNQKLDRFKVLGEECSKSGLYEYRLAKMYLEAGMYENAKNTLLAGLSYNTAFDKELKSELVDVYVALSHYEEAERIAKSLIADYKSWYGGYYALGEMHLINRRFHEGIKYLEKSNELHKSQGAHLMLVIAYHQIDEHKKVVSSMKSAIGLGDSAYINRGAVISTAYSLIAMKRLQDAKDILSKHQKMTSGSENDPGFIRVVMYLKKNIDETTASQKREKIQ